ncbi:MAG TPA: hypothetical protein VEA39_01735 [Methylophilaceae bacterium]|nr:hypothetical protein [Methylophilaceae bacterium]
MNNKINISAAVLTAAFALYGCDKGYDEPGGDNPRVWSSPIANPEKPKTDDDYDGKKDPAEPVTPEQRKGTQ